jgi:acyl-CoA thioesterase-2
VRRTESADVGAKALDLVLATLRLEQVDEDTFHGRSLPWRPHRIYGGQVLAQALLAAGATVAQDRAPHSIHAYFLRAGDPAEPVTLSVERLRDGNSFSARRTHALQHGRPILSMISSFQESQPGVEHWVPMPSVPPPDEVPSVLDMFGSEDPRVRAFLSTAAFDLRHVTGALFGDHRRKPDDHQAVWMRARAPIHDESLDATPDDGVAMASSAVVHAALLAFACDQIVLEPVLRRHGLSWLTPGMKLASLDHAMWWHRPARADEWLLYVQESPSAQGSRGLGTARVYSQDGRLVASIAQEGMVRSPHIGG